MFYERNPYFENNALLKFLTNTGTTICIIICLSTIFGFILINKLIKKSYVNKKLTDKKDLMFYALSIITTLVFITTPIYYTYENTVDKTVKPSEYSNYLKITDQKIESKDPNKIIVLREYDNINNYTNYNLNNYEVTLEYDVHRQQGYLNIVQLNKKSNNKIKSDVQIYIGNDLYHKLNELNKNK